MDVNPSTKASSEKVGGGGGGGLAPKIRLMTQTNFVPNFVPIILVFILFLLPDKILQNEDFFWISLVMFPMRWQECCTQNSKEKIYVQDVKNITVMCELF